ncbi:hypothetical protein NAT51_08100 [Flavobacterium amniphilum]|nr:hypothetical protein [Flavobacterium amniphilum]
MKNFTDNRKLLIPKINEYLSNPSKSIDLKNEIESLGIPYRVDSFSSNERRTPKTDKGRIGDISDIYTFCLNADIYAFYDETNFDWDFKKYLNSGKELHLCTIWYNWFLPVYYMETTYEFIDKKNKFNQYGTTTLTDKNEIDIVQKIDHLFLGKNHSKLDLEFLNKQFGDVSTDCSEKKKASVFDCIFSDIKLPSKHIRKSLYNRKNKKTEYPEFVFTEYLDDNRKRIFLEAEVTKNNRLLNPLKIVFDTENNIVEAEISDNFTIKKH